MPGKDEKQKQEQEFNDFYFNMMKGADEYIAGARFGTIPSRIPEIEKKNKENALNNIATAIAYAQVAMQYGKGEEPDSYSELADQAKQNASKIRKNREFREKFESMSAKQLRGLLSKERDKDGKENISYDELAKRVSDREKTPEGRMNILVYQLEQSTQKSIFGKIKSVFTGNSQQYKDALAAMKNLAAGKLTDENDIKAAKGAIEAYVTARGAKVRDHQYGRDRFDAFMRGLGEVMTPEEFQRTCSGLNAMRKEVGEPGFDPLDYLPTEEKRAAFEKVDRTVKARNRAADRADFMAARKEQDAQRDENQREREEQNKQAELQAKAEQELKNKPQQLKNDVIRINRDEETKGTTDSHNLTLTQRNQIVLDQLRNHADEYLNYGRSRERDAIKDRLIHHPAFRLAAKDIIYAKGLDKIFKIPETQLENMEPDTLKKLSGQVKELQTLDQQKHPEMVIKEVKVEVPQQQKTVPQAGGGGIGLGG